MSRSVGAQHVDTERNPPFHQGEIDPGPSVGDGPPSRHAIRASVRLDPTPAHEVLLLLRFIAGTGELDPQLADGLLLLAT
jgi:hypothetical protein